uniref:Venom peptide U19-SYTX-Sth1d n=1 Tax=Scytodes thoracica TaxID=1112478 RepID=A0A0A0V6A4_SCYTH|nr:venom peptide U19-SYTX-Sth1d [Scytodes thoracica]
MNSKASFLVVLAVVFIARVSHANPSHVEFLRSIQGRLSDEEVPTECYPRGHRCDAYDADYCCDCCDLNNKCVACTPGCKKSGYKGCRSNEECCSGVCYRTDRSSAYKYCVYRGYGG